MKKSLLIAFLVLIALAVTTIVAQADPPVQTDENGVEVAWKDSSCTSIQEGTLLTSAGVPISTGFDEWGYNYQAHMFNGGYCDAYRNEAWCQVYADVELIMKWNDAWLANVDCDGDGKLDRPNSYIGSGAWTTNHQKGTYEVDGQTCTWEYFTKIIAVPADATLVSGVWYAADGTEIGPAIWGVFATIQSVYNDPCGGSTGIEYLSPDHAGFGGW